MTEPRGHPWAWLLWLIAAGVSVLLTRNPWYLLLLSLEFALVARPDPAATAFTTSPLRLARSVIPLTAAFNALFSHTGTTVLLRLPDALPLLGGAITLEALLYGLINGLALTALFAAFAAFNLAVPLPSLLRLVPRAFAPLALVVSIAITYIPATQRQFRQIQEAQAIRGHRVRGWRDWLPLLMPLLIGGLERSLHLAEAMAARGFAGDPLPPAERRRTQWTLVGSLGLLLGGTWLKLTAVPHAAGDLLLLGGSASLLWLLWHSGRRSPHTTYRRHPWRWGDTLTILAPLPAVVMLAAHAAPYTPYPTWTWPPFAPEIGLALLGFLAPMGVLTYK